MSRVLRRGRSVFSGLGASLLLVLLATPLAGQQRWAIIVGVGDYEAYGDEVGGDLQGPVNDARAVSEALIRRWGFDPDRVRLLLDADASRAAIRAALVEWLPATAAPGDIVVFYFAGHGSQSWDDDGDEADGLDETIAPHDVRRATTEQDITDDQLREWLTGLHRQRVVVILDSCHSGTATRMVTPFARPRMLAREMTALPRPLAAAVTRQAPPGPTRATAGPDFELEIPHVLEIAASQPDQAAMDVAWPISSRGEVEWGGAFTRYLVEALWSGEPGNSYDALFTAAAGALKLAGFSQDPSLSATPGWDGQPLFGLLPAPAAATGEREGLTIRSVTPDRLTIAIPPGRSIPPGTRLRAGGDVYEVGAIRAGSAEARRISIGPGAVRTVGDSISVLPLPPPPANLLLSLDGMVPARAAALRQAADGVEGITISSGGGVPDLRLHEVTGEIRVIGRDGAVRGTVPVAELQELVELLSREVAIRHLTTLVNPAQRRPLRMEFGNRRALLRLGQTVELQVGGGTAGYLTVIDLAPDGVTTLLYPNDADAGVLLPAGATISLPTAAMRSAGIRLEAQEPTGSGVVRALITSQPLRLEPDGTGRISAEAAREALRLMLQARPGTADPAEWSTAALVYSVEP